MTLGETTALILKRSALEEHLEAFHWFGDKFLAPVRRAIKEIDETLATSTT